MKRRAERAEADDDHTLGGRLIAAVVAVLFFAPVLALAWFVGNEVIARNAGSNPMLPAHWLRSAIVAAAVLGFVAPRLTPTLFGWLAEALVKVVGLLFWPWRS